MFRRGFTLIELLVVISVISLLSSIVLASLNSAREKARVGAARYFASQVEHAAGDQAVLIWRFEEGAGNLATDLSGNGNTGSLVGPAWDPASYHSSQEWSLDFDGINSDRVTVAVGTVNPELNIGGDVTQMAWIYPLSTGINQPIIRAGVSTDARYSLYLDGTGRRLYFHWYDGSVWKAEYATSDTVPLNEWSHVAAVRSGTTVSFYVNGKYISSIIFNQAPVSAANLHVGHVISGQSFQGRIDDVYVFAKALTASEVGKLYAESVPKYRFAEAE